MKYLIPGISVPGTKNIVRSTAKAKPKKKKGTTAVENETKNRKPEGDPYLA